MVFPATTAAPGSDIQFPGDDALLPSEYRGNAANAVTGEIRFPAHLPVPERPDLSAAQLSASAGRLADRALQRPDHCARASLATTVDVQGGISLPEVGRISVAGRTATQAEDTLRQRLSRLYRNVDVSVSLRQLRTIQVTVSGAAFAPGTYTIPASATAFNVLNAAGGPTANGSLRDIRVLRNGRLVGTLDIYPLIGAASGNPTSKNGDINLQSGDNIYIPDRLIAHRHSR